MSEKMKKDLSLTGLFAAFMFLQLTVSGLGNRAGEGCLSTERREFVYYALQVFVILGFFAYAAADRDELRCNARRVKQPIPRAKKAWAANRLPTPYG